jgi:hypothetical protein
MVRVGTGNVPREDLKKIIADAKRYAVKAD